MRRRTWGLRHQMSSCILGWEVQINALLTVIIFFFFYLLRMLDRNLEILKYETTQHHRQKLRAEIDQNMIDGIEISHTPSANYHKAYKDLYFDELQKSVNLHEAKKNSEFQRRAFGQKIDSEHSRVYGGNPPQNVFQMNNSISAQQLHNLNYKDVRYEDYDELKDTKALNHTLRNYDGGQKFYENHDRHLMNQMAQLHNMRTTLSKQLSGKDQQRNKEWLEKREEQLAMKEKELRERQYDAMLKENKKWENKQHCNIVMDQMQEQRLRRGRKSVFSYQNVARHNPITNPIEYHIDNPYILKQMQNNSRSSSIGHR